MPTTLVVTCRSLHHTTQLPTLVVLALCSLQHACGACRNFRCALLPSECRKDPRTDSLQLHLALAIVGPAPTDFPPGQQMQTNETNPQHRLQGRRTRAAPIFAAKIGPPEAIAALARREWLVAGDSPLDQKRKFMEPEAFVSCSENRPYCRSAIPP